MKTIVHRDGCLHVETPLGIVNIRVGMTDRKFREVENIEVLPGNYAGENRVVTVGGAYTLMRRLKTVRV